jgi:hypothetical protein
VSKVARAKLPPPHIPPAHDLVRYHRLVFSSPLAPNYQVIRG